jgi:hypothetical protein
MKKISMYISAVVFSLTAGWMVWPEGGEMAPVVQRDVPLTKKHAEIQSNVSVGGSTPFFDTVSNPFESLQCKKDNGERIDTTACNPFELEAIYTDSIPPAAAIRNLIDEVNAGNYEKVATINAIFYSCMLERTGGTLPVAAKPECDPNEISQLEKTVEVTLQAAAHSRLPGAEDGYLGWLFSTFQAREKELEAATINGNPSTNILSAKLTEVHQKLVANLRISAQREGLAKSLAMHFLSDS